jgi:ubiquinone/menaquinone biosynthesis C-methylase UbiE
VDRTFFQSSGRQVDVYWRALKRSPELSFHASLYSSTAQQFKPGLVLDLGSEYGMGSTLMAWANPNIQIVGLDLDLQTLKAAKFIQYAPHLLQANAHQLPFASGSFSGVCLVNLLHLVNDPPLVLAEAHRVLRVGGAALITMPKSAGPNGEATDLNASVVANLAKLVFPDIEFPDIITGKLPNMPSESFQIQEQSTILAIGYRR